TEEYTLRALSTKLSQLSTFFTQQNHYSTVLTELVKTMPNSVRATDITVNDKKEVTFIGSTGSYADLAGFYAKLRQAGAKANEDVGTYFLNPILTAISRDD